MTDLYLQKSYETTVTRKGSGEWDAGDTSTSWTFDAVTLTSSSLVDEQEKFSHDGNVSEGDTLWLVIAEWSTGDSFGWYESEYTEVFGSFSTEDEARRFAGILGSDAKFQYDNDGKKFPIYRPWTGYFDQLVEIHVESFIVES